MSMSKILYQQDKGHGQVSCLSHVDHPHYFLHQTLVDPVLNMPENNWVERGLHGVNVGR